MNLSIRILISLGGLALALASAGCSDMVTFAGQNRDTGIDFYNQGKYPEAAGAFRSALRQDPRDYQSHYWLGLSSLELKNYQQAIVAFRSCLETRPVTVAGRADTETQIKALEGLAQAIFKSDEADLEVNKIETAARSSQGVKAAQDFFILAKVYRYRGLPDMAIDYYNRACLQDNKNFAYLKEFGLYLEQLGETKKAEQPLRQAYAVDSTDADVTAALRRLGVVPGLSLRNKDDLNKPLVPKGPIPEVDMDKVKSAVGLESQPKPTPTPSGGTATTPRD